MVASKSRYWKYVVGPYTVVAEHKYRPLLGKAQKAGPLAPPRVLREQQLRFSRLVFLRQWEDMERVREAREEAVDESKRVSFL